MESRSLKHHRITRGSSKTKESFLAVGEIHLLDFGSGAAIFLQANTLLRNHPFQIQFTPSSEDMSLFLTSTKKDGVVGALGWLASY